MERLRVLGVARDAGARLRASLDRQQSALATGLIGFFEWNVSAGTVTADSHFAGFYGIDPEAFAAGVPLGELLSLIHPDDRGFVEASIEAALSSLADYTREFRLVHADGMVR